MKYISGIINIVFGLFVLSIGVSFLSDYFGGTEKRIKMFESLLQDGTETIAMVDSVYTEIKIKNTTSYSSKYFFEVEGEEYSGDFSFDSPSDLSPIMKVRYMPKDPTINDVNIKEQLMEVKKEENSSSNLIIGFGALIISLYFLYYKGIRRFMKPKEDQEINVQQS